MNTLAEIKRVSESEVFVFGQDHDTPEGHFTATAKFMGIPTTYLLKGSEQDSDEIVGRIELNNGLAYKGNGLKGGHYLGRIESFSRSFHAMA